MFGNILIVYEVEQLPLVHSHYVTDQEMNERPPYSIAVKLYGVGGAQTIRNTFYANHIHEISSMIRKLENNNFKIVMQNGKTAIQIGEKAM